MAQRIRKCLVSKRRIKHVVVLTAREAKLQRSKHVLQSRRGYGEGGLTQWFKEDWRDVKTGKKCGRSGKKDKGRPYPACRPKAVASRISKAEARKKKTGPKEHDSKLNGQ